MTKIVHRVKSILLCSGGVDSTTLAYWLIKKKINFIPLFIDYGQHCASTEYDTLINVLPIGIAKKVKRIQIRDIYEGSSSRLINEANLWEDSVSDKDLYLPYRNLLLLTIASSFAQSRGYMRIYAGFINSNHAKEIDCSAAFFNKLSKMLTEYGKVKIEMPFRNMSKVEVARLGLKLKAPIAKTYSCQAKAKVPCGACPNCVERLTAIESLN